MPKRRRSTRFLLLLFLVALAAAGYALTRDIETRTHTYLTIAKTWRAVWPLEAGADLGERTRFLFRPVTPVRVEVEPGLVMTLDPDDYVGRKIIMTGQWENPTWQRIEGALAPGGTFIDVGAHIGYYSLKAAKLVGDSGTVITVEPNPVTLDVLRQNILDSQASAVELFPVACSDTDAELELFHPARSNTGVASLSASNAGLAGQVEESYRVQARPLDSIVADINPAAVNAIKIDVEGAEMLVLQGARRTLTAYDPVVIVEVIERQLDDMGTSADELVGFLADLGYQKIAAENSNWFFAKHGGTAQSR